MPLSGSLQGDHCGQIEKAKVGHRDMHGELDSAERMAGQANGARPGAVNHRERLWGARGGAQLGTCRHPLPLPERQKFACGLFPLHHASQRMVWSGASRCGSLPRCETSPRTRARSGANCMYLSRDCPKPCAKSWQESFLPLSTCAPIVNSWHLVPLLWTIGSPAWSMCRSRSYAGWGRGTARHLPWDC